MKFKPLYFYLVIVAAALVILLIFSQPDEPTRPQDVNITSDGNIPDDEVHRQSGQNQSPGKNNVSESFSCLWIFIPSLYQE